MYRKKHAPLPQLLALCKRNGLDITAENYHKSNGDGRDAASIRKANRAKVAKLARCSPDAVRSWVLGASKIPVVYYELLAYKWDDEKGKGYAKQNESGEIQ